MLLYPTILIRIKFNHTILINLKYLFTSVLVGFNNQSKLF